MRYLPDAFSLLIAIAGWYYMFYSQAAHRLSGIEAESANRQRVRLRRINGFVMFLLAVALFAGFRSVDYKVAPGVFLMIWISVFVLMLFIVLLALLDVRPTARLRNSRQRRTNPPPMP